MCLQEFADIHAAMHKWSQTEEEIDECERRFLDWVTRFKALHGDEAITPYLHAMAAHAFALARKYGGIGKFNNQGVEGKNGQQSKECHRNVSYGKACLQLVQREHRLLLARWEGLVRSQRAYDASKRGAAGHE